MEKDKNGSIEKAQSGEKEKVDRFLGLEKSISTKRENPFTSIEDGAGPSSKKRKEKESILNTSRICSISQYRHNKCLLGRVKIFVGFLQISRA